MMRSAYERLPQALRRDEFFLVPTAGSGGAPGRKRYVKTFVTGSFMKKLRN